MLSDFENNRLPVVEVSTVESRRFEMSIGRLLVPFGYSDSDSKIANLCSESAFDLIFVRAHASRYLLSESLNNLPYHNTIHADSLLYFRKSLRSLEKDSVGNPLIATMGEIAQSEHGKFVDLVRETFSGYINHYSSNSLLSQHRALEGYVEWATTLLMDNQGQVFVARDNKQRLLSFIAIKGEAQSAEIILNGTSPSARGRGVYSTLLKFVQTQLSTAGFDELVTSTQSSNENVIKVWFSGGFSYVAAINTFHVMKAR